MPKVRINAKLLVECCCIVMLYWNIRALDRVITNCTVLFPSSIVSMIEVPVEAGTLHAALRLILRLTREHKYAVQFAEQGGPRLLLSLTQASAFQGFLALVTLIFRHILEEPASLRYCMEKVRCFFPRLQCLIKFWQLAYNKSYSVEPNTVFIRSWTLLVKND